MKKQKKLILAVVALLCAAVAAAQTPQSFTYQAVVRDAQGRLVTNREVGVRLTILQGTPSGTAVYAEHRQVATNANGLIATTVGNAQRIDWLHGPYYLRSEIDPNGGTNYTLTTTQQLLAVPYAIHAHMVDTVLPGQFTETDPLFSAWDKDYYSLTNRPVLFSGDYNDLTGRPVLFSGSYNDLTDKPVIPTVPTAVSAFTNDAGYLTSYTEQQTLADVVALGNAAGDQLKDVSDPTDQLDAVNLRTFDAAVANITRRFDSILAIQWRIIDSIGGASPEPPQPCYGTTYSDTTAVVAGSFTWHGIRHTASGDFQHTYTTPGGCDSIVTLHLTVSPLPTEPFTAEGATRALFSISSTQQVGIARGNLQHNASLGTHSTAEGGTAPGTWRFAPNQWDTVGIANVNASSTYDGWIDLFGWGTSGWNSGANCYQPWSNSTDYTDYYVGGSDVNELYGTYANADWAYYNAISNGGNAPGMWRTLTQVEWQYILLYRNASTLGDIDNARYTTGSVCGVYGLILFPDSYIHPGEVAIPTGINNIASAGWYANAYTADQWAQMEAAGCVFLPAAGYRYGQYIYRIGFGCEYWLTTHRSNLDANAFFATASSISANGVIERYAGLSVRPVRDNTSLTSCNTTTGDTTASATGSFTWRGTTYTATGNYTKTLTNVSGCDSVVTLHLTITPSSVPAGFVDLGLPSGTLWAECNLGATTPEGAGNHYAWGEVTTKTSYLWTTYRYCNGSNSTLTKYCDIASYGNSGFTDTLTTLEIMDDAATQALRNGTHTPTEAQWQELMDNTTATWTTLGGVYGRLFTAANGNSIFLPINGSDTIGYYWSSSLCKYGRPDYAKSIHFNSDYQSLYTCSRSLGFAVRPVRSSTPTPCVTTYGDTTVTASGCFAWRGICRDASGDYRDTLANAAGCDSVLTQHLTITTAPAPFSTTWVDLGLPSGLLWAESNLGATVPEGYGNHYAWGEIVPKCNYSWSTYRYCNGSETTLTKYCSYSSFGYNGFTDNLTTLEAIDDAATQALGSGARTPTSAEWQELMDNTTATWTTRNGVYGRLFTATNGNSLFLPAAGIRDGSSHYNADFGGYYWSSSLSTDFCFGAGGQSVNNYHRFYGFSVRAVRASQN
ncbi:MAG: hypothetical protein IJU19_04860 [Bacteroidales bacterium]|nr:hypothetical protein [Bacteroidales bacterium]